MPYSYSNKSSEDLLLLHVIKSLYRLSILKLLIIMANTKNFIKWPTKKILSLPIASLYFMWLHEKNVYCIRNEFMITDFNSRALRISPNAIGISIICYLNVKTRFSVIEFDSTYGILW